MMEKEYKTQRKSIKMQQIQSPLLTILFFMKKMRKI